MQSWLFVSPFYHPTLSHRVIHSQISFFTFRKNAASMNLITYLTNIVSMSWCTSLQMQSHRISSPLIQNVCILNEMFHPHQIYIVSTNSFISHTISHINAVSKNWFTFFNLPLLNVGVRMLRTCFQCSFSRTEIILRIGNSLIARLLKNKSHAFQFRNESEPMN